MMLSIQVPFIVLYPPSLCAYKVRTQQYQGEVVAVLVLTNCSQATLCAYKVRTQQCQGVVATNQPRQC